MSKTLITSESKKGFRATELFRVAYDKAELDEEQAQCLNEHGNEFQDGILELIQKFLAGHYANKEVKSSYGYLSGYERPIEIADQIDILRSYWPNLNPDAALKYYNKVYPTLQLPDWIEGPFAIIRPRFFSDKYEEELEEVLKALAKDRYGKLVNNLKDKLCPKYLRQTKLTLDSLSMTMKQQPRSDILIVLGNFGIRYPIDDGMHIVASVRWTRKKFVIDEYGPGAKDSGAMILTNPNRLQRCNDLWIDCAGDEYAPGADGDFDEAPHFIFNNDKVWFSTGQINSTPGRYSSPSLFLSQ